MVSRIKTNMNHGAIITLSDIISSLINQRSFEHKFFHRTMWQQIWLGFLFFYFPCIKGIGEARLNIKACRQTFSCTYYTTHNQSLARWSSPEWSRNPHWGGKISAPWCERTHKSAPVQIRRVKNDREWCEGPSLKEHKVDYSSICMEIGEALSLITDKSTKSRFAR